MWKFVDLDMGPPASGILGMIDYHTYTLAQEAQNSTRMPAARSLESGQKG